MKKLLVIFLVASGLVLGYWMARENQKLFELPVPETGSQEPVSQGGAEGGRIAIGMDTWEVREILGTPDRRKVLAETPDAREEEWIYGTRHLYFTNGFLSSLTQ